ncbi:MAG: 3'-5' exonuclease [Burkholderiaceae bacterium]|nr:3'-5' exonuclease [Burkholderiaceae bacterium]
MTPYLVFDLETIPDAQGLRRLNPQWDTGLDDQQVIELALAARQESHGTDFLPLHLHKIAVVGCVFRDSQGFRVKTLGSADDPEASLINGFFKTIERYTPQVISWNGSGFDFPVLHYRSLIHGVPAPRYWDMGEDDRDFKFNNYINRYHSRHIDLMDVLAKFNGRANAPLDDLAKLCGFPGKMGMDGGQVWQAWSQGHTDSIRAYCETDVVNTWLVFCRFRLLKGELDRAAYDAELKLVHDTLQASGAPHWQEYLAAWDYPA